MKTIDHQRQTIFIDLRARGRTLQRIAAVIGVPESTLSAWDLSFVNEIRDTQRFRQARRELDIGDQITLAGMPPEERLWAERRRELAAEEQRLARDLLEIAAILVNRQFPELESLRSRVFTMLDPGTPKSKV